MAENYAFHIAQNLTVLYIVCRLKLCVYVIICARFHEISRVMPGLNFNVCFCALLEPFDEPFDW